MTFEGVSSLVAWNPYAVPGTYELAAILVVIGLGLVLLGRKIGEKQVKLPRMGKIVGIVIIIIWAISILTFLKINKDIAKHTGSAVSLGPIFPITVASAIISFGIVAYLSRKEGFVSALGNGFLAFIAGPMVFEFPFLLIVIPRVSARLIPEIIFLTPLFAIIFTTFSLLLLSSKIAITKNSIYFYSSMIFVFALWALEGYSYPTNPAAFSLNAVSKVLGFACIDAMFVTEKRKNSGGIGTEPEEKGEPRETQFAEN